MQTNSRTSDKDLLIFRSAAKGKCFVLEKRKKLED